MRGKRDKEDGFYFEGFSSPNTTPVPDEVFDVLAPRLSEAELRVLLYILRRTFGFKKRADAISLRQLVEGIKTRSGVVLDEGTGMSKRGVLLGLRGLLQKGVIEVHRAVGEDGQHEVNVYSLRFRDGMDFTARRARNPRGGSTNNPGVVYEGYNGSNRGIHGDVTTGAIQETVGHSTDSESTTPAPKQARRNVVANPTTKRGKALKGSSTYEGSSGEDNEEAVGVISQLKELGVHPKTAERLVRESGPARVREVLEYMVWRAERGWVPEINAAGWIVAALRDDYVLPRGFQAWRRAKAPSDADVGGRESCMDTDLDGARAERLKELGVTEADQALWREVLRRLKERGEWTPALSMAVLRRAGPGRFEIVVPWPTLVKRAEKRLSEVRMVVGNLTGHAAPVRIVVCPGHEEAGC